MRPLASCPTFAEFATTSEGLRAKRKLLFLRGSLVEVPGNGRLDMITGKSAESQVIFYTARAK